MMNGHGKSDGPVVPAKPPNKAGGAERELWRPWAGTKGETPEGPRGAWPAAKIRAEGMEGRGLAKGT